MRTLLTTLLAFAAGIALMLWLPGNRTSPHSATNPTAPAVVAPATASSAPDVLFDRWPDSAPSPEQVIYAQPRLVRAALDHLTPRVAGQPNLYVVTFAGDGGEDVFRNEAEYAAQLFASRFGATAHTLVLENNPTSLRTHPLASWSNLEAALDGLAGIMRPEQDILMLYVTSHGDEDHTLLVNMDPLPLDQIGAADLAGILAQRPFQWKAVVVNACYSGGFIPPLRGPGTLILTAARADRSSFGCGSDSDITYFGKAWLVDALNRTDDFVDAFEQASKTISQWESQDKLTPSEPQIDVGQGIAAQLDLWRNGLVPGPRVPFAPSTTRSAAAADIAR